MENVGIFPKLRGYCGLAAEVIANPVLLVYWLYLFGSQAPKSKWRVIPYWVWMLSLLLYVDVADLFVRWFVATHSSMPH